MTSQVFLIPVMIILMIFIIVSLFSIGSILMEYLMERRKNKFNLEDFLRVLNYSEEKDYENLLEESNLSKIQKNSLKILLDNMNLSKVSVESIAQKLLTQQENEYDKVVSKTDLISKLAPMFGLMGTLIPLGPGLLALGQGNTEILSNSLLVAFDTTIVGLISAAITWVISRKRKAWYKFDLMDEMAIMEYLLERKEKNEEANK